MTEVLSWAEQLSQIVTTTTTSLIVSHNLINILIVCYFITCKRSVLFGLVFLLSEFCGLVGFFNIIDSSQFYVGYLIIDSASYAVILSVRYRLATLTACVTMILFDLLMVMESSYYGSHKTILFELYPYIVSVIHVCIIISLYDINRAINNMVNYFSHVRRELGFLCYFAYHWHDVQENNKGKSL